MIQNLQRLLKREQNKLINKQNFAIRLLKTSMHMNILNVRIVVFNKIKVNCHVNQINKRKKRKKQQIKNAQKKLETRNKHLKNSLLKTGEKI